MHHVCVVYRPAATVPSMDEYTTSCLGVNGKKQKSTTVVPEDSSLLDLDHVMARALDVSADQELAKRRRIAESSASYGPSS